MLHQFHWTVPFRKREREHSRTVIASHSRVFLETADHVVFAQVHISVSACQIQVDEVVPIWVFSSIIGRARRDNRALAGSAGRNFDVCTVLVATQQEMETSNQRRLNISPLNDIAEP